MVGICISRLQWRFLGPKFLDSAFKRNYISESEKTVDNVQGVNDKHDDVKKFKGIQPSSKALSVFNCYPEKLWKNQRKFHNIYLVDEDIAGTVAKHVCNENKDVYVFEANPGPGILTNALLENDSRVRVFEREIAFHPALQTLKEQYKSELEIVEEDVTLLPKLEAKAKFHDVTYMHEIIKNIEKKDWKNGIALKFVSVVYSSRSINFMRYMLARIPSLGSLFSFGRCQFFLLVSDVEFSRMMARPKGNMSTYRDITVMYNLFFDVKCLLTLPIGAFVPLAGSHSKKKGPQNIYFVCLTPKPDLLQLVAAPHLLPELYFFIRHHFMKRKSYVIPTLEQWIPWCGPKFIKKGMRVFTRFGDLSPPQILQLFQQFSSLPEYEDSIFRAAVEHFFEHHHHQNAP